MVKMAILFAVLVCSLNACALVEEKTHDFSSNPICVETKYKAVLIKDIIPCSKILPFYGQRKELMWELVYLPDSYVSQLLKEKSKYKHIIESDEKDCKVQGVLHDVILVPVGSKLYFQKVQEKKVKGKGEWVYLFGSTSTDRGDIVFKYWDSLDEMLFEATHIKTGNVIILTKPEYNIMSDIYKDAKRIKYNKASVNEYIKNNFDKCGG